VTDYSEFPFEMWSLEEITQMFMDSVRLGDQEFAAACRKQINKRGREMFTEAPLASPDRNRL